MKVSIGYTVGSSLSIFLILCISMNAHLVNGQIASIATANFAEDLSQLHVVVCFSNDSPSAGVVAIMTNLDILDVMGQQGNTLNVILSNNEVCQSKPIPLLISSQNIGAKLDITLASVVAVGVDSRMYSLQIPGQSCGSTLSSTSGVIEWPGFSMGNPYTSKCTWQIEASFNSVVELIIEYFDLAVSESCANDSLTVYDGLESSSNVLLQPSCGLAIPWPAHPNTLLSTGRTITLVFTTNSTNSLSTFRASYKQVVPREEYFFAVDANNGIIYKQNRFGVNFEEIPISGLLRPVAVDYDPIEQRVYITDVGRPMVSRVNLDGSGQEEVASVIIAVPDGLAVDPVSRVVYWTDVDSGLTGAIINVARLDGSFRRILVNTNIDSPRDIVVQPYQGHVYWSDWGSVAKIERMNGDGTDRTEVVNSGLGWPNGIAIDMAGGKLYWADAQLNKIERSNLDGSARELLKAFDDDVHPFGLIFVDNALFWTDWVTAGIDVTDRNLQNDPSTLLVAGIPTRFHGLAFHSTDDPAIVVNDCSFQGSNGGCEELCLPVPSGTSCVAVSPTFNNCPADIVIVTKDVQFVSWSTPTVDNPSGTRVTISASHPQSSLSISPSDGTIQVTYTAVEEFGHSARSCVFNITALSINLATELEIRLMDIINTISGENITTEEVVMASETIAELSDNEDFLEENPQRIESVILSLESVVRAGEASINVTDPVVRTINNLMNLDRDILEDGMIEGGRAVAALEGQITNFHTNDGNFSTVLDNVGVTAVKIDGRSVGSSLAYANVFPKNEITLYDGALQEGNTRLFSDGDAIPLDRTATSISVPTTVLEMLGEAGVELTAVPVTFIIYGNDVLFRPSKPTEVDEYIEEEDNSTVTERVESQIISAIIRTENTSIVKLPPGSPVITTFVSNLTITVNETIEAHDCVVWSYNENTGEGFWTKDGCERMSHDNRGLTMCSCDRLGSFAVLIRVRKGHVEAQVALYYITLIGSIISGLALIGCLVIFVSLKSFRSKQPTHIHINLCLSLLGFYIAFLLSPLAVGKEIRCTVASVFIHFFSLATLAWMSAEAMNMYYLFLKAARSTVRHFIPIACLLAYGLPAVCALLVVFLDNSTDFQSASYCFIHPGYALYFGFLTEVGAMFVFNFIIFIWLICKILCRPLMVSKTAENAKRNEIIKRVRHAILFWFILGLSWIFGFFAAIDTTTLIFDYLYCFFISIQGILMFVLLCVANPAFRGIFKKKDFMRTKVTTQTTTKNLTSSQLGSSSQSNIPMDSIDNPSTSATE